MGTADIYTRFNQALQAAKAKRVIPTPLGQGLNKSIETTFTDKKVGDTIEKWEVRTYAAKENLEQLVRESSPGRFDFIVEGERGVITAHRNWSQKAIDRIAKNYGWGQ